MSKSERLGLSSAGLCSILVFVLAHAVPTEARSQGWPEWADRAFGMSTPSQRRRSDAARRERAPDWFGNEGWNDGWRQWDSDPRPMPRRYPELLAGGPRPAIAPKAPSVVDFLVPAYGPGEIVIDSSARRLYRVLPGNRAYEYPISVGREGFSWTGTEKVSRRQSWPDWHPPAEMRERQPELPKKMTGGIRNPLGAMALYLGNTLYRIHGTNDEATIGQAASSGCFRMMNSAVLHLSSITPIGTTVHVAKGLPTAAALAASPQVIVRSSLGRPPVRD